MGAFPFIAPEVYAATPQMNDYYYDGYRADVWSLGVILQEMILGIGSFERRVGVHVPF